MGFREEIRDSLSKLGPFMILFSHPHVYAIPPPVVIQLTPSVGEEEKQKVEMVFTSRNASDGTGHNNLSLSLLLFLSDSLLRLRLILASVLAPHADC